MENYLFISYSSHDKTVADAICHYLEDNSIPCWIAPRDILPGNTWAGSIIKAIRNCSAMLLIYSKNSNESGQVANEVDKAFSNGKTIIPFMMDETPLNDDFDYYLSRKHWLVAYPDYRMRFAELLKIVTKLVCPIYGSNPVKGQPKPSLDRNTNSIENNITGENTVSTSDKNQFSELKIDSQDTTGRMEELPNKNNEISESIEKESNESLFNLGMQYENRHEYDKALIYYFEASEMGLLEADYKIGMIYINDLNSAKGIDWLLKAAERGHSKAQNNLGNIWEMGKFGTKKYDQAFYWYLKAAKNGLRDAQYNIGRFYEFGYGTEIDTEEAKRWYRKAALQGDKDALMRCV